MKIYLFVAVFVFICVPVFGQGHVVVYPASLTPLSASTVANANAALAAASGNSAFDVRIAYMTSAGGIEGDRFQEYLGFKEPTDRYMEFFATPYEDGTGSDLGDLVQEHQRLLEKGVDTLGGGGNKSVLIVYTTVLYITEQGTSYSSKKNVLYGDGLTGCDLRRFTQIEEFVNPPTDYCVASAPSENDNYLNWIAGHMADAMGDDYVITGTIAFQGNIYCDPAELYINDQHNGVLENTSDFHPPIRLMVHPSSEVGTISWSSPTSSATLFTSGTGENNTLNFQPAAFEQFNELVATWGGGQTSSITVLPVNFQVGVDEELLLQQSNQIEDIKLIYQNNHTNFPPESAITITLTGATAFPGAPSITLSDPGTVGNIITWTPDGDACEENSIVSELQSNSKGLNEVSIETNFRIICPFVIEDLMVRVPYTKESKGSSPSSAPIMRTALHGEELFIVSKETSPNEDFKRLVNAEIIWEGDRPAPNQYWGYLNEDPIDNEPIWHSYPEGVDKRLTEYEKIDQWELNHNDYFPPKPPDILPGIEDVFSMGEESFDVRVSAFDYDKTVKLTFTRENKFTYPNLIPNKQLTKLFDKATKIKKKLGEWFGKDEHGKWRVKPVFKLGTKVIAWQEEDPSSRFYFKKTKFEGSFNIGITLGSNKPDVGKSYIPLIIPPIGPLHRQLPGGLGEAGVGLRGTITVGATVSSVASRYNYEPFLELESWDSWTPPDVAPGIDFELKLGAYVKASLEVWNKKIISFDAGGECGPELDIDLVWGWDEDIEDYDFYVTGELAPFNCDITASLSLVGFPVFDFSLAEWLNQPNIGPGPYPFTFFKDE